MAETNCLAAKKAEHAQWKRDSELEEQAQALKAWEVKDNCYEKKRKCPKLNPALADATTHSSPYTIERLKLEETLLPWIKKGSEEESGFLSDLLNSILSILVPSGSVENDVTLIMKQIGDTVSKAWDTHTSSSQVCTPSRDGETRPVLWHERTIKLQVDPRRSGLPLERSPALSTSHSPTSSSRFWSESWIPEESNQNPEKFKKILRKC